ncbi:helix-turn-helix domain-containing protein [Streptomyces sp. NPDC001068]|uniref:helix-turn-helix domain-containing protein n=1 Tax=Streptomyces sp. NPDC001068 TaxID=3364544 RepID=UPI00369ACA33
MYDVSTRERALTLVAQGRSLNSVSKETGVSRAAIRSWQHRLAPLPRMTAPDPGPPADERAYAYLLGLYLGDGCISTHPRGTGHYLRIACADAWPGLIELCRDAIKSVRPATGVYLMPRQGCTMVTSYHRHWPALFPQHGPGKKHERPIVLAPWQQAIVDTHPWEFVRGLVHSDGCRVTNWTTRVVAGERKRYEYPRYFFTNRSDDILTLCTGTLDKLGVQWTRCTRAGNAFSVSVAKRAHVALMDTHVGPKY